MFGFNSDDLLIPLIDFQRDGDPYFDKWDIMTGDTCVEGNNYPSVAFDFTCWFS